jgi:hypothetical protein
MILGHHIVFDKCPRCASPRVVSAYARGDAAPKPQPTCMCFEETKGKVDDEDARQIDKGMEFDRGMVDAHIFFKKSR